MSEETASSPMRRYPETPERRAERIRVLADEAAKALRLTPGQHRTLFGRDSDT